ncbi:hypothetical protein [Rubrolithibacter danxiaensis]|uniref:hypothetical protein n=1 Tax=Rubrolithibacter danxiaensis TaxID=3390805 RepID=UPI003BF8B636
MQIARKLADLHSEYKVYTRTQLTTSSNNIICSLSSSFPYLYNFYQNYIEVFSNEVENRIKDDKRVRSTDLPFIGEDVVSTGEAKFFFVFEGSLSDKNKLSITALAHLWLTEESEIISSFSERWWKKHLYNNVHKHLDIKSEIATQSYVFDARRTPSNDQDLIYREIEMLKPKLVVCIGTTARETVGMRYIKQDAKFHYVRFPKYIPEGQKEKICKSYKELREILDNVNSD